MRRRRPRDRIVERAHRKFGSPIYVRHEIVHNTYVVNDLKGAKGAIFIESWPKVPPGATLVFSARREPGGAREAQSAGFRIFDATCPLVTKVHVEVAKLHKEGYEFIMIGHKGHPEVEGTMASSTAASTWSRMWRTSPGAAIADRQARGRYPDHAERGR